MSKKHTHHKSCKLAGFNNLKKALSFSFYDFVIAPSKEDKFSYIDYINKNYSAKKISILLNEIVNIIGANVLYTSLQDYEPFGASSLMLLSDIKAIEPLSMHLDKSHITAHTYPDFNENNNILSFRVDIELSTCGEINPLTSLNKIFNFFDTDIVTIDYVVRGFTRNEDGKHIFIDHEIDSIKNYIDDEILKDYILEDLILKKQNIWQLKLLRKKMQVCEYFSPDTKIQKSEQERFVQKLREEMQSVFKNTLL